MKDDWEDLTIEREIEGEEEEQQQQQKRQEEEEEEENVDLEEGREGRRRIRRRMERDYL